jgi:hypothetical protein
MYNNGINRRLRETRAEEQVHSGDPSSTPEELALRTMWDETLYLLRLTLPPDAYRSWLAGSKAVAIKMDVVRVWAKDDLAAEWLNMRIKTRIERALSRVIGRDITVEISAPGEPSANLVL